MRELAASEKRTIRLAMILVIPLLLFVAYQPLRAKLTDAQDQLELERGALVREQAAIAASRRNPELQHVADSLMQNALPRLFSGKDDVMASAELVWYLDEVAGNHHVLLNENATRTASKAKGGVRTLNVDVRGESDLHGVLEFLQALERGPKLTRVTRLDISKPSRDADDIETVTFAATVTGYALAEGSVVVPPARKAALNADTSAVKGAP
ncbi:MAG: GspMb/PilO family protein [Gemmatimonadaceae bacterium]